MQSHCLCLGSDSSSRIKLRNLNPRSTKRFNWSEDIHIDVYTAYRTFLNEIPRTYISVNMSRTRRYNVQQSLLPECFFLDHNRPTDLMFYKVCTEHHRNTRCSVASRTISARVRISSRFMNIDRFSRNIVISSFYHDTRDRERYQCKFLATRYIEGIVGFGKREGERVAYKEFTTYLYTVATYSRSPA